MTEILIMIKLDPSRAQGAFVTHFLSISAYEFAWTGFILGANTKNIAFCFFSVFYIALERVNLIIEYLITK